MAFSTIFQHHGEDDPTLSEHRVGKPAVPALPAKIFVFLVTSSLLFAFEFEWDRYHIITNYKVYGLSVLDKALLTWLLVAKSLAWFLPAIMACTILIAFGLMRAAAVTLIGFWVGIFFFMSVDLVSVGFTSYHAWDYVPHLRDVTTRWLLDCLTKKTLTVLAVFAVSGPTCLIVADKITNWVRRIFPVPCSRGSGAVILIAFVFMVLGVVPALAFFSDRGVLNRVLTAVPLATTVREYFRCASMNPVGPVRIAHAGSVSTSSVVIDTPQIDRFAQKSYEQTAKKFAYDAANPGPVDVNALVESHDLPNIILIIFESFRHSAIGPGLMKDLNSWSEQGLRLQRHYSGSNCSHLGLFSLFYGRSSLGYYQTLDRKIQPQLLESLRRSGYRITLLTSGEMKGFRRLDQFINDTYCDRVLDLGIFAVDGVKDWPDSDRRKLTTVKDMIKAPQQQPQCILFYLMSSHYGYSFPPEFAIFPESPDFWQFFNPWEQIRSHLHRYSNSLLFLEHELMKVLRSIDLKRNVVIITGDHGESMAEDGVFRHATRMSEIQLRVPCVMVGAGVETRKINTATGHSDIIPTLLHALAGKSIPVLNSQGRDLLAEQQPADEVVLAPANGPEWEGVLMIHGQKRVVFNTNTFSQVPSVEFAGLVDEAGQAVQLSVISNGGRPHGNLGQ